MAGDLEKAVEKGESVLRGERVLVVDDLQRWLDVATDNLKYYGCEERNIFLAYNIKEGERIFIAEKPSIVLTDINFDLNNLGDTSGLDFINFTSGLRQNPLHPIIAMSSLKGDIKERALQAGADYFINKSNFVGDFDGFVERYKER